MFLKGICFVTDRTCCPIPLFEAVESVLQSGITWIQYREKNKSRRSLYGEALQLRHITNRYKATLIINDHPDIALAVDADGVHLGQDDLPLREARKVMKDKIIGISTHNIAQASEADAQGADYIGVGPIFRTTTKDAGEPLGIDNLRLITHNVTVPIVAIGGITLENVPLVLEAGSDAIAVASAFCKGDIAENARRFIALFNNTISDKRGV